MSIITEEEQEQLKADGKKLVIDKSCENCQEQYNNSIDGGDCKILMAMSELLYSNRQVAMISELSCELHERSK